MATPMLVMGRFDPSRILDYIEQYKVNWFAGIPTMYRMLIAAGAESRDLSSMQLWGGGGDAFPHEMVEQFRQLSAAGSGMFRRRAAFITGYGMAETAGQVSITPPFAAGDACIGWFLPGVQYRIVDADGRDVRPGEPGELWLKSPGMMKGYWNDEAATQKSLKDGWLRTGDLMRVGKWGAKYFVSREKDMIKVGGYSVFPAEVEQHLERHPAVESAVVVGMPHAQKGELPVAGVVLKYGVKVSEDELLTWSQENIAAYRCPRRVVIVDEIPKGFGMKPQRRIVRERFLKMGLEVRSRAEQKAEKAREAASP
jgi:acyl-coenzyme A synthetase/AMP-(fatty) acid ligase